MTIRRWSMAIAVACIAAGPVGAAGVSGRPEFDEYGGWTRLSSPPTGSFHIKNLQGRLWLVTPLGNAFFWKGVSRLDGEVAAEEAVAAVKALGFNGAGPFAAFPPGRSGIAYLALLDAAGRFRQTSKGAADAFPDVFDPEFERALDEAARLQCGPRAGDPWLVGYLTDIDLPWERALDDLGRLPASAPAKQALVAALKQRYADDVGKFAAAWRLDVKTFDDLAALPRLEPGAGADAALVRADREAMLSSVAQHYFDAVETTVRRYDRDHMILGPRFAARVPRAVALAMPGRVSALCLRPQTALLPARLMAQLYRDTGLAMLVMDPAAGGAGEEFGGFVDAATRSGHAIGCALAAPAAADQHADEIAKANGGCFHAAAKARIPAGARTEVPRYEVHLTARPPRVDGVLDDWQGANWLALAPSPYVCEQSPVEAQVALAWDQGHIYIAGRIIDRRRKARTLTAFAQDDTFELMAAGRTYLATLQPGHQVVYRADRPQERTPAPVSLRPMIEDGEIAGYAFEAGVPVPVLVGPGFVVRAGLRLRSGSGAAEAVELSFPPDLIPERDKTQGELALAGPR